MSTSKHVVEVALAGLNGAGYVSYPDLGKSGSVLTYRNYRSQLRLRANVNPSLSGKSQIAVEYDHRFKRTHRPTISPIMTDDG